MRITLLMAPSLSCVFRIKPSAPDLGARVMENLGAGVMEGSPLRMKTFGPILSPSRFSRVKFV